MTQTTDPTLAAGAATASGDPYLVVDDLTVKFPTADGLVNAVTNLSYSVHLGRTLGIVGESGSGKSVSSMAVLGLHDTRSARITGSITLGGTEVVGLSEAKMREIRGNSTAMIFQDALAALHPFFRVGAQLAEAFGCTTFRPRSVRRATGRSRCSIAWASPNRRAGSMTFRTSSPVACVSA